jgi:copper chaperone CopZ
LHSKILEKVTRVDIDLASKRVQVESDQLSQDELLEQLKKTGKGVTALAQ